MIMPKRINPIIKLTENCNYGCVFCRYAIHRQQDDGVNEELIKKIVLESASYNLSNGVNNINVIFHGGEPLLYGVTRLSSVLAELEKEVPDGCTVEYSIQSNSSLITDEYIALFKKYDFDVGISLDGPRELNSHMSTDSETAVKNAIKAYHTLKDSGVHCGFLSVITNDHLDNLNQFFDFWINNDVESLGLCYAYNKVDGHNVDPIKLGEWLKGLYDLYFSSPKKITIREFDLITRRILKHPHNACAMSCRENCGTYLTLTPNGNVEFCDDYDLSRAHTIGNLNEMSVIDMVKSVQYQQIKEESNQIIESKCRKCDVFSMCRAGCARNDQNDTNYFCATYRILYPYISQKVQAYLEGRQNE